MKINLNERYKAVYNRAGDSHPRLVLFVQFLQNTSVFVLSATQKNKDTGSYNTENCQSVYSIGGL